MEHWARSVSTLYLLVCVCGSVVTLSGVRYVCERANREKHMQVCNVHRVELQNTKDLCCFKRTLTSPHHHPITIDPEIVSRQVANA